MRIMRVLLVEDCDLLRSLFARVLKGDGYEVHQEADGHSALDCLSQFDPDLILTDLSMPRVDGLQFIRSLRCIPQWDSVPVIVMTAAPTLEAERDVRLAGAVGFLVKPIDAHTLLERVGGFRR